MADELGSVDEIGFVDDNHGKMDPIGLVDDIGLERATAGADPIGLVGDSSGKIGLGSAIAGPIGLEAGNSSNKAFGSGPDEQGKEIDSRLRLGGADRGVVDCDLGIDAALNPQVAVRTKLSKQLKGVEVDGDLGIEGRTAVPGPQVAVRTEQMKEIEGEDSTGEKEVEGEDSTGEKDVETFPRSHVSSKGKCRITVEETGKTSKGRQTVEETRKTVEETLEETRKGSCAQNLTKEGRQPPEDTRKGSSAQNQTKEGSLRHRQLVYLLSLLTSSKREEQRLRSVICRSLLLPVVSAIVLWFSRGDPLLVVWRLSLMLCYGCLFWTNFLIETLGRGTVFMYITYGLLLAAWADSMLNPAIGVLIVHLNSHFATGLLGYALAERLQRQGIERSAFDVPIPTSDEEVKRLHVLRFFGGLALAGPMLGVAGGMLWLVWHSADYAADELVMDTLILLPAGLVFGIVIVAMFQLRGALISADHIVFVMLYFIFVTLLRAFCNEALDNVVGMIITWVAVLALSGLLGYCVYVLASFKHMHIVRSSAYMVGDDQGERKLLELMEGTQEQSQQSRNERKVSQMTREDKQEFRIHSWRRWL